MLQLKEIMNEKEQKLAQTYKVSCLLFLLNSQHTVIEYQLLNIK